MTLASCPYCGFAGELCPVPNDYGRIESRYRCSNPDCVLAPLLFMSEADWNRRAHPAPAGPGLLEPARYFASGPEGCFFADDLALADKLIRQSGFDNEDWTVTDLHDPTGERRLSHLAERANVGDAVPPKIADDQTVAVQWIDTQDRRCTSFATGQEIGRALQAEALATRDGQAGAVAQMPGNWPEDAALENGGYECRCMTCGATFYGHKRRVTCKACAHPPRPPRKWK